MDSRHASLVVKPKYVLMVVGPNVWHSQDSVSTNRDFLRISLRAKKGRIPSKIYLALREGIFLRVLRELCLWEYAAA